MSRRALALLVGALAILVLIAGVGLRRDRAPAPASGAFLPELAPQLGALTGIVVTGPGKQVVATLRREGDRWVVTEAGNYPADLGKLRQNLQALAEAAKLEEKTSAPEFYGRLGVGDPGTPGGRGLQLDFAGPKPVPSIIIGDTGVGGGDRAYMRRVGEAASWLVSGRYQFGQVTGDWLDKQITDLPAEQVRAVTITHPGVETLRLDKADTAATDFSVRDLPAGRALRFPGVANSVGAALADLTLEGVATREVLGANPPKPVVARFEAIDGLVVEASAWRLASGTRFTFQASAPADKPEAAKAAAAINARVGGWVYTLPSFKAELLTRRLGDLLQD